MKHVFSFPSLMLALALGQVTAIALPPPPPGITEQEVVYGQGGGKPLRAEVIQPKADSPRPAVILVHGGGWKAGEGITKGMVDFGIKIAQKGFVVVTIDYRLSGEAKWPACIQDCQLAVRWLRANAATYNVDPKRIGCWGGSAGGHLVACLGTMGNEPSLIKPTDPYAKVSSAVQAVVDLSGPTDFRSGSFGDGTKYIDADQKAKGIELINELIGLRHEQNPALWEQASPIVYITPQDPPFLLLYGDQDHIVSPQQGTVFYNALKRAGVPAELRILKNTGHVGGKGATDAPPELTHEQLDDVTIDFLVKTLKP